METGTKVSISSTETPESSVSNAGTAAHSAAGGGDRVEVAGAAAAPPAAVATAVARQEDVPAQLDGGVVRDPKATVERFTRAAERGDAAAQYRVGFYYEREGATRDLKVAAEWYAKAAAQEHAPAQYALGQCHLLGKGVERDLIKATGWYAKAAAHGHAPAQYELGLCYARGEGIEGDPRKAIEWITRAAERGDAAAQYQLGLFYEDGQFYLAKDPIKAAEWFRKAVEQGHAAARYSLSKHHLLGKGVEKDPAKATDLLIMAAEQGYAYAQYDLAITYYSHDELLARDPKKGIEWITRAAEQENVTAQFDLAMLYLAGDCMSVTRNITKAVEWFTRAEKQRDSNARHALKLYKKFAPHGVSDVSDELAVKWFIAIYKYSYNESGRWKFLQHVRGILASSKSKPKVPPLKKSEAPKAEAAVATGSLLDKIKADIETEWHKSGGSESCLQIVAGKKALAILHKFFEAHEVPETESKAVGESVNLRLEMSRLSREISCPMHIRREGLTISSALVFSLFSFLVAAHTKELAWLNEQLLVRAWQESPEGKKHAEEQQKKENEARLMALRSLADKVGNMCQEMADVVEKGDKQVEAGFTHQKSIIDAIRPMLSTLRTSFHGRSAQIEAYIGYVIELDKYLSSFKSLHQRVLENSRLFVSKCEGLKARLRSLEHINTDTLKGRTLDHFEKVGPEVKALEEECERIRKDFEALQLGAEGPGQLLERIEKRGQEAAKWGNSRRSESGEQVRNAEGLLAKLEKVFKEQSDLIRGSVGDVAPYQAATRTLTALSDMTKRTPEAMKAERCDRRHAERARYLQQQKAQEKRAEAARVAASRALSSAVPGTEVLKPKRRTAEEWERYKRAEHEKAARESKQAWERAEIKRRAEAYVQAPEERKGRQEDLVAGAGVVAGAAIERPRVYRRSPALVAGSLREWTDDRLMQGAVLGSLSKIVDVLTCDALEGIEISLKLDALSMGLADAADAYSRFQNEWGDAAWRMRTALWKRLDGVADVGDTPEVLYKALYELAFAWGASLKDKKHKQLAADGQLLAALEQFELFGAMQAVSRSIHIEARNRVEFWQEHNKRVDVHRCCELIRLAGERLERYQCYEVEENSDLAWIVGLGIEFCRGVIGTHLQAIRHASEAGSEFARYRAEGYIPRELGLTESTQTYIELGKRARHLRIVPGKPVLSGYAARQPAPRAAAGVQVGTSAREGAAPAPWHSTGHSTAMGVASVATDVSSSSSSNVWEIHAQLTAAGGGMGIAPMTSSGSAASAGDVRGTAALASVDGASGGVAASARAWS